jgi:hypothetical protein
MGKAVRVSSNTVHNSNRLIISGGFWLHYASSKGESWINWGSKWVLLIEYQLILVRPNTHVLGLRDEVKENLLPAEVQYPGIMFMK